MAAQICVARIGAAHGVRGAVKLWTFTEDPLAVKRYGPLATKDGARQFEVVTAREAKGHLVATLKGVTTREEAERLNGLELYVAREKLPATDEDEYYHADLIGLAAVTPRERAARPRHRDPQFRRRRHHRDRAAAGRDHAAAVHQRRGAVGRSRGRACGDRIASGDRGRRSLQRGSLSMAADTETPEATIWRATVLTLFPEMFPGRSASALPARRWRRACGRWRRATSGIPPPTATAASTTPRPAAAPAWCCAPMCWRPRSMPRISRPDRPRAADEPAGSAIDPVAGRGTRRRTRAADRLRPVRGRRPAGDRGARAGGGFDRRLRAFRRRNRRHGADRRLRPAAAGRDGKAGFRGR